MNTILRNRFAKIAVWLAAEILLNYLGIDDLADFGEYVFECQPSSISANHIVMGNPAWL